MPAANTLDETHDPALRSWVDSANLPEADFPVQNLPFGRFIRAYPEGAASAPALGVAIGDHILDLSAAAPLMGGARLLNTAWSQLAAGDLKGYMQSAPAIRRAVRVALSRALRVGSELADNLRPHLVPMAQAAMVMPCAIGDYTDFYTGIHHARAVGQLFRPDQPLLPNYKWVPIGYHGRSSSIVVSDTPVVRPNGQKPVSDGIPVLGPSQRLDYELELGAFVAQGNPQGQPVTMAQAEQHLFGVCLLNDWSARDLQAWEYQPLGPFLAKNFATSISPWIVTMEALAPFRRPFVRDPGDPSPLPYLHSQSNSDAGAIAVDLTVSLQTEAMRSDGLAPAELSQSEYPSSAYWTLAQLVAHHTVGGCNLQSGDLFGTGTLSGPSAQQAGSLLELSQGGRVPFTLPNGEQRSFLQDGDSVVMQGRCRASGFVSISLGQVRGTVQAAPAGV
jgi:fumarylacetoacetase